METEKSAEKLFSKTALDAKKSKYGRLINPIGKFPTSYLFLCLALISTLLWFAYSYRFENFVTLSGVTLLKNKPIKLVSYHSGIISEKFVSNGDLIESNFPIYSLVNADSDNCNLIPDIECKEEVLIEGTIAGSVEQLYKSPGDHISFNEPLGIIVPSNEEIVFELYIPVGLSERVKLNNVLDVEIVNPFKKSAQVVSSKVVYKSKIPVEKNKSRYYILKTAPIDKAVKISVGSTVTFKIINESKTFFDLVKRL